MAEVVGRQGRTEQLGLRVPLTVAGEEFAWRILRLLNGSRLALSVILLLTLVSFADPRIIGNERPIIALSVLGTMFAFAAIEVLLLRRKLGTIARHVYIQSAADTLIIATLTYASGGISSGLGGLLVVSTGSLTLLVKGERAFLLAAFATTALLIQQFATFTQGWTTSAEFTPTGILGVVTFTIVGITQLIRRRIIETEALAEQRGVDLRNLVELNDYIIQHLRESIVVVDGNDDIRLINASAAKQLGKERAREGFRLTEASPELAKHLADWRARNAESERPNISFAVGDGSTRVEPHFARLGRDRGAGVLIFLEDTSIIAERVQQTKLAALGRLSASIAHEIRNPLGALSHAGQLLAESPGFTPAEHRLTDIIRINSGRVSAIVESVLALSRGDKTAPETLALRPWAEAFVDEFTETLELYEDSVRVVGDSEDVTVEMDRTHLHQIVWNLCDNAVKYASAAAGAIAVELRCGHLAVSGRPYLEIADRGAGVRPEQVEQIFEPFFTAQPGGTGLGLYISRELCERNGGSLRYYPRPGGGSSFRIVFADPKRWQPRRESA